jgi:hypothetical protein
VVCKDRAKLGDEPWIVFKTVCCCLVFKYKLYIILLSLELLLAGWPFVCLWGNPIANVSQVIGNSQANFIKDIIGHWQPSDKLLKGIGNFFKSTYLSEG